MENYSLEPLPEPNPRERRITRVLLMIWLVLGIAVAAILCYVVSQAFRPLPQVPLRVGDVEEYPVNSVNLEFVNTRFFDDVSNKELETLPLQVVRGNDGKLTIFLARSTRPEEALLIPRQCVVEWDDSLQEFLELCAGSRWERDGKYTAGPAPRDLDRFPVQIQDGVVFIEPKLEKGAAHP